jgi:3-methyl-2-oxobutanoate hydroxymethyltransferase
MSETPVFLTRDEVLVLHDMVGLFRRFTPKFVKVYADVYSVQMDAVKKFIGDVQGKSFPAEEHTFTMKDEAIAELRKALKKQPDDITARGGSREPRRASS